MYTNVVSLYQQFQCLGMGCNHNDTFWAKNVVIGTLETSNERENNFSKKCFYFKFYVETKGGGHVGQWQKKDTKLVLNSMLERMKSEVNKNLVGIYTLQRKRITFLEHKSTLKTWISLLPLLLFWQKILSIGFNPD